MEHPAAGYITIGDTAYRCESHEDRVRLCRLQAKHAAGEAVDLSAEVAQDTKPSGKKK